MAPQNDPKGQGFTEYALILFLAVVVIIIILYFLGPAIGSLYSNVMENFPRP
jgi:Flp pilus assembly pilin Flp